MDMMILHLTQSLEEGTSQRQMTSSHLPDVHYLCSSLLLCMRNAHTQLCKMSLDTLKQVLQSVIIDRVAGR